MGASDIQIPVSMLMAKEMTYKGSFRYGVRLLRFCLLLAFISRSFYIQPGDYKLAIALAAQGKLDLKPLVTHRFDFSLCLHPYFLLTDKLADSLSRTPLLPSRLRGMEKQETERC